jgi:hypothetical protein
VVRGEQRVGLAAAELGLQAVHRSRGRIPVEAGGELGEESEKALGEVGLLAEADRVEIVGGSPTPVDQAQVGGEERLVEAAIGDVGAGLGDLPPGP